VSDLKTTPVIKSNKVYDVLKYIAQIFLPAAGTLYFGVAQAWGLANSTQVVGTIVAIDTFLGVLLHISNTQYNNSEAKYDGTLEVTETEDKKNFSLNIDGDPMELDKKDELVFKVRKQTVT
jgi:hypothetical protein